MAINLFRRSICQIIFFIVNNQLNLFHWYISMQNYNFFLIPPFHLGIFSTEASTFSYVHNFTHILTGARQVYKFVQMYRATAKLMLNVGSVLKKTVHREGHLCCDVCVYSCLDMNKFDLLLDVWVFSMFRKSKFHRILFKKIDFFLHFVRFKQTSRFL